MVAAGLRRVFAEGRYILLAAATGLAVLILATWLPNLGLVWQIAASASIPFADKVNVLTALVGSIGTNFTVFSALSTVAIATLFGANVATIESTLGSSGFEVSLGTLLSLLFGGANDLADGADAGDISSQIDGSGFDLRVVGSALTGDSTTRFDIEAGRLLSYETNSESPVEVTLSFPDEETGDPVMGFMQLTTTVDFEATLRIGEPSE